MLLLEVKQGSEIIKKKNHLINNNDLFSILNHFSLNNKKNNNIKIMEKKGVKIKP